MLLFGRNPECFLPQSVFKIELNYGSDKYEIIDFIGPLVEQAPQIWKYMVSKAFKYISDRSSLERKDISDYPTEIVREVIIKEWYMRCVYFRDPEGNLFEICQDDAE